LHNEPSAELPRVAITGTAEVVTVVLSGEFDVMSECFLADCLTHVRRERPRRLVFEAAQVTFIDCASARLIAGTEGWLPAGVKPVIVRPSPVVRRVLRATGLGARCELQPCG
jgi:anti-anti-sigma factor